MKRLLIISVVILAHLILLAWLIRDCDNQYSTENSSDEDIADSNTTGREKGTGGPEQHTGTENGPENSGQADSGRLPKDIYHPEEFTPADTVLPPGLKSYTKACRSGILLDITNKKQLWAMAPQESVPIASMVKMMTVLLLMESIETDNSLGIDTTVPVTRSASAIGGRQVFLDPREQFTLEELLKCTIIRSANDTAFLIAEYLSKGDVQSFVRRMNKRADQLGFPNAHFSSPHGLPLNGANIDKASPLELAYMAKLLLQYPTAVKWASTRLDYIRVNDPRFDKFQLLNTNKMVSKVPGVNGMKTGYTDDAGYCMTATCTRNGRTLIAVVTGCKSGSQRNDFVKQLLEWGYQQ